MKEIPKKGRKFTQVAVAQISATILGSIFWLVFAKTIHPIAYGRLTWLVSTATILSTICLIGLGKTVTTYYPKERNITLLKNSTFLVIVASLGVGLLASILIEGTVGLLVIGLSTFSIAFYSELAKQRYDRYMWMWIGARTASIILPFLIYHLWGVVAGILAGLTAAYFIFGAWVLKQIPSSLDLSEVRKKMSFALSSWGADIGGVSVNFLDKILIGLLFSMTVLGIYQFAYRIFVLFGVLPRILFFFLLPEKSAGRETKKIELYGILVSTILTVLIFVLAPLVVPKIFPNFEEGIEPIRIMSLAIIPAAISRIKSSELYSREKANIVLGAHLLALAVGVTGIAISFSKSLGLIALSLTLLSLQITLAAGLFILPKLLNWGEKGKLSISLIGMALITALLLSTAGVHKPQIEVRGKKVRGTGLAMDTNVEITVLTENTEKAKKAIEEAFDEIKRVEDLMSTEKGDSEIYALNNSETSWVELAPEVIHVLKEAKKYSRLTDGLFDPTVEPLVNLWMEKVKKTGKIPENEDLSDALELVGWENLEIDEEGGKARFLKDGMEVTLGGIAKGYAVDRACEIINDFGIQNALVNIGGDMRATGEKSWKVSIQHPREGNEVIGTMELENEAIVTSGDYRRYFFLGTRRIHHIINPKTGYPAVSCMSVTIISDSCIEADALSTGIFIAEPEEGKALLESIDSRGLIISTSGKIVESKSWDVPIENL